MRGCQQRASNAVAAYIQVSTQILQAQIHGFSRPDTYTEVCSAHALPALISLHKIITLSTTLHYRGPYCHALYHHSSYYDRIKYPVQCKEYCVLFKRLRRISSWRYTKSSTGARYILPLIRLSLFQHGEQTLNEILCNIHDGLLYCFHLPNSTEHDIGQLESRVENTSPRCCMTESNSERCKANILTRLW